MFRDKILNKIIKKEHSKKNDNCTKIFCILIVYRYFTDILAISRWINALRTRRNLHIDYT